MQFTVLLNDSSRSNITEKMEKKMVVSKIRALSAADSQCYNCHSNDKRGSGGMSGRPALDMQRAAIQNPSVQPFSTAASATPDPNYDPAALAIATKSLATATVGISYTQSLAAIGGTSPYSWSTTSTLPVGLALTGGVISGTPTVAGSYPITVKVTDSATPAVTTSQNFTLVVSTTAPLLDGAALYFANCAGCHDTLASSTKRGRTAAQITAAIGSVPSMSGIALSTAEIAAIATALQ